MKSILRTLAALAILACALPIAQAQPTQETTVLTTQDRESIEKTLIALGKAWDANDAKAYGDQLTADCEWINIVGMHWRGKADVLKAHAAYFSTMFKGVHAHRLDTQVTAIAPGVAIVVATMQMDDFTTPAGNVEKDMHDRMSYVMLKQPDGRWLIRFAHNTTINPVAQKFNPAQ